MDDLTARLGKVAHFRTLPLPAVAAIVNAGCTRRYPMESVIFVEGEPCAGMFVLLSGRVHLCKPGPQGQEQIIGVIDPVIMFNEVAVLDGGANPTSAVAARDSVTWSIGYQAFQALMARFPVVGLSLLRVLAARNRALIARCDDLSYRSVQARLAKLLLDVSEQGRRPVARREQSIRQLSARIGTVPELVSRSLRALQANGVIKADRVEIVVTDARGLARLALVEAPEMDCVAPPTKAIAP